MKLWVLLGVLLVALALRLAFLAFHLRDPGRLWSDYERGGLLFRLARLLDWVTFVAFLAVAVWALWGLDAQTPYRYVSVMLVWLGVALLERFPVHRFPRLNVPGAMDDAIASLITNLLLSFLGALVATALTAVYFWWRG